MPRKPILLSAILLASVMGAATAQTGTDSAANIKAHMAFLADDRLKGREAGSPEYDIAADYVAGQMKTLGLKPMGENGGYFQTVPLVAARAKDEGRRTDLEAGMSKLLGARVAWAAADNALQIHGGNGFALEYPVSRILCDARILNIFEGAAEIQAQVIARRLVEE